MNRIAALVLFSITQPFFCTASAFAERVGFSFSGTINGSTSISLFDQTVTRPANVTGTFSYDTNSDITLLEAGVKTFEQKISGGLTLVINGNLKLSASEYVITVGNDQGSTPLDYFSVDYANFNVDEVPAPIEVNSTPWDKSAAIKVELRWPANTFPDPDEPKLTSNRPITPVPGITAFVGSGASGSGVAGRSFSSNFTIASLIPVLGDYNFDGQISWKDYLEWRKAFDSRDADSLYADGNVDGQVDAADYVVWRDAFAVPTVSSSAMNLPEQSSATVIACLSVSFFSRARSSASRGTR